MYKILKYIIFIEWKEDRMEMEEILGCVSDVLHIKPQFSDKSLKNKYNSNFKMLGFLFFFKMNTKHTTQTNGLA